MGSREVASGEMRSGNHHNPSLAMVGSLMLVLWMAPKMDRMVGCGFTQCRRGVVHTRATRPGPQPATPLTGSRTGMVRNWPSGVHPPSLHVVITARAAVTLRGRSPATRAAVISRPSLEAHRCACAGGRGGGGQAGDDGGGGEEGR